VGRGPGRWYDGRWQRAVADPYLVLIERAVLREPEPVSVEAAPGRHATRPGGFWRGTRFYRILRILQRRFEPGVIYVRVVADRGGCFDLRRVRAPDPWTWDTRVHWELVAESSIVRVPRLPSDPKRWRWER